jgi:hypothetical protein
MRSLNNQAIIVLGMHRSGSSALTRVLNLHGMELGSRLMAPQKDNETGFWEHQDIVDIHDQILKTLDSAWDEEILPDEWWLKKSLRPHRKQLAKILLRDFSQFPLWGTKDPRMCRLLPLWLPLFDKLNCRPVFVLGIRHPLEVAKSLEKRNGFSLQRGERLWFQHSLLLERSTRGFPRTIVPYEQLLSDWKNVVCRVQSMLKNPWPKTPADGEIEQFLNPAMRHHKASDNSNLSASTLQAYEAFINGFVGNQEAMTKTLDVIYSASEAILSLPAYRPTRLVVAPMLDAVAQLNSEKQTEGIKLQRPKIRLLQQRINRWIDRGLSWLKRIFDRWDPPGGHLAPATFRLITRRPKTIAH